MSLADVALERFFTLSLDLICIAGVDGYFKRVSPAFGILGYTVDELLHIPFIELVHPEDRDATRVELANLSRGKPTMRFENRYRCKDGSYRWLAWTSAPDQDGLIYAVARDVTYTRQVEHSLRRTNQLLDTFIDNIPHMVFVKDADKLAFVRLNRAGERLLGLSQMEMLGKTDYDFFPPDQAAFFQNKDRETLRGGRAVQIPAERIQTPAGVRLLQTTKVPICDAEGTPRFLLGISEDVTDRRAADQARAWLAAIVEDSDDAIIGRDLDGKITSWNRGAERMFGFTASEIIGQSTDVLMPEDRHDERLHLMRRILEGERVSHYETFRRRKSGELFDVSVTLSPIRDSDGTLVGVSMITRDISGLKQVQRDLMEARDATEAANRELESFSYSVAHDLRAPLRSIDGFSQALLEDCHDKLDADGRKYLGFVRESAQLMADLIDDILNLSRVTRAELLRERIDVSALARTAWERVRAAEPERSVEIVIERDLVASGDARLIGVVFDNLLGNAFKFTRQREVARIEVGTVDVSGQRAYFVRDNGAGFDPRYASKLFGVFQRLHAATDFEGTGIGLATVQRIVHRHGGRVWGESAVGQGATFFFTLGAGES